MNRPHYESQQDRDNEQDLIRLVDPDGNAIKLPEFCIFDFVLPIRMGDKIELQVWEVKKRTTKPGLDPYKTLMIAKRKVDAAHEFMMRGIEPWFLIEYDGTPYSMNVITTPRTGPTKGGRADRGDPYDQEPCYHFEFACMAKLTR